MLRQYGISFSESGPLLLIEAFGNKITAAEIARQTWRKPHTISTLLQRMEKKGLIKRTKGSDKRRTRRISLTKKGLEAYRHSIVRESMHKLMSSLTKEERQQLESCLKKLRDQALKLSVDESAIPSL